MARRPGCRRAVTIKAAGGAPSLRAIAFGATASGAERSDRLLLFDELSTLAIGLLEHASAQPGAALIIAGDRGSYCSFSSAFSNTRERMSVTASSNPLALSASLCSGCD